ncbi:hypothetical protein ACWT_4718 [Actinoplanes sp. SE50]|uniref:hypothetical protein n=1 Tax=unclassified Actinoplanes TaxID=2626549 RepID=UPI00023EBF4F|nr:MULTISPECIES: hypothetical protein [unclassified Actinoplanes]AEV85740.1 hypothetical protein ACPL_4849 [Actinoplanes sp. SE50/110]ATO84133.1 hypothetical protein ACWT_4718 [Actinoplanes sp. SE50]SLM01543.1 uncharacterized protein ACSP50_4779 [Actinoplanes sp. SE50/110]
MSIAIPSSLVPDGSGVPSVCSRHGEAPAVQKPVKFWSKPPAWALILILFGALPYLIVVWALRKEVRSQAWPFCSECVKLHKNRLLIGLGLIAVLPISLAFPRGDSFGTVVLLALVVALAGAAVLARGSYRMLPGGVVSRDGAQVDFPNSHPAFDAAAQAAYHQAAQRYAAWQAGQHAPYQAPQA